MSCGRCVVLPLVVELQRVVVVRPLSFYTFCRGSILTFINITYQESLIVLFNKLELEIGCKTVAQLIEAVDTWSPPLARCVRIKETGGLFRRACLVVGRCIKVSPTGCTWNDVINKDFETWITTFFPFTPYFLECKIVMIYLKKNRFLKIYKYPLKCVHNKSCV